MPVAEGIHYVIHQPRENNLNRPPLILLHGAGGSFLSWHPYLRRLEGETVYTLDLPGHGESEGEGRNSISEYTDDIARFMVNLDIGPAVIGGLSMGSGIALTMALKYPHQVRALALVGSGAKLRVANSILQTVGVPETFDAAVENINRACFSSHASDELLALSKRNMLDTGPSILLKDFLVCNQFDVTAQLAQIQIPVFILCGAEDIMTLPKYSRYLKDNLPNAQLHILEETGHMAPLEQPETVAKLLKSFLDELPLQA